MFQASDRIPSICVYTGLYKEGGRVGEGIRVVGSVAKGDREDREVQHEKAKFLCKQEGRLEFLGLGTDG